MPRFYLMKARSMHWWSSRRKEISEIGINWRYPSIYRTMWTGMYWCGNRTIRNNGVRPIIRWSRKTVRESSTSWPWMSRHFPRRKAVCSWKIFSMCIIQWWRSMKVRWLKIPKHSGPRTSLKCPFCRDTSAFWRVFQWPRPHWTCTANALSWAPDYWGSAVIMRSVQGTQWCVSGTSDAIGRSRRSWISRGWMNCRRHWEISRCVTPRTNALICRRKFTWNGKWSYRKNKKRRTGWWRRKRWWLLKTICSVRKVYWRNWCGCNKW